MPKLRPIPGQRVFDAMSKSKTLKRASGLWIKATVSDDGWFLCAEFSRDGGDFWSSVHMLPTVKNDVQALARRLGKLIGSNSDPTRPRQAETVSRWSWQRAYGHMSLECLVADRQVIFCRWREATEGLWTELGGFPPDVGEFAYLFRSVDEMLRTPFTNGDIYGRE